MERFVKIVNSYYPLTIFAKSSVLDASQCFVYSSETFKCYSKPKHCIDGKKAYRRRSKLIPDIREVSKYLNIKRSVVYLTIKKVLILEIAIFVLHAFENLILVIILFIGMKHFFIGMKQLFCERRNYALLTKEECPSA